MHPASIPITPTQDDPADALDLGAIGLAEAIAVDFGGDHAVRQDRRRQSAPWLRWLRAPPWTAGSDNGIALRAAIGESAG